MSKHVFLYTFTLHCAFGRPCLSKAVQQKAVRNQSNSCGSVTVKIHQADRVISALSSFPFEWELHPALPRLLCAYVLSSTHHSVQALDTRNCAHKQLDIIVRMQFIAVVRTMIPSFWQQKYSALQRLISLSLYKMFNFRVTAIA